MRTLQNEYAPEAIGGAAVGVGVPCRPTVKSGVRRGSVGWGARIPSLFDGNVEGIERFLA